MEIESSGKICRHYYLNNVVRGKFVDKIFKHI